MEENPLTKSYPKQSTFKTATILVPRSKKITKGIVLGNTCWQLYQIRLVYTQKAYLSCAKLPKMGLILAKLCFLPDFLHGYIRHIRDISQLCLQQLQCNAGISSIYPCHSLVQWVGYSVILTYLRGFETCWFWNFSIFFMVSDSVSNIFGTEISIEFRIEKNWCWR